MASAAAASPGCWPAAAPYPQREAKNSSDPCRKHAAGRRDLGAAAGRQSREGACCVHRARRDGIGMASARAPGARRTAGERQQGRPHGRGGAEDGGAAGAFDLQRISGSASPGRAYPVAVRSGILQWARAARSLIRIPCGGLRRRGDGEPAACAVGLDPSSG
jgi:hypothetical protein